MFVHVLIAFPETAGKTLEETESMFTDPLGPKYIGTLPWKTHVATDKARLLEHGEFDEEKARAYGHAEDAAERSASETRDEVPKL